MSKPSEVDPKQLHPGFDSTRHDPRSLAANSDSERKALAIDSPRIGFDEKESGEARREIVDDADDSG